MNNITIIVLLLILLCLCISCNQRIQYYIVEYLFSNIAPTTEDHEMKNASDKLYMIKKDYENEIKKDYSNDCELKKVTTIDYKTIKDDFNTEYFNHISDDFTKPVLIKNVYTQKELEKYNFDYMKKHYGTIQVEAIKYGTENVESLKTTFSKYLDTIKTDKKWYLTVNNSLANAIDKLRFLKFYDDMLGQSNGFSNIFIGNKHSFTHLHSEIVASCASHLNGIKKWYLIDQVYSEYLNSIPDKTNGFHVSAHGFNTKSDTLEKVPRYEIICEPGDVLYVPPWWWHETLNLTDENIMISYRPSLFTTPYKTNLMYTSLAVKSSLAFNNLTYPLLISSGVFDPNKDMVVESLKQIDHRMPEVMKTSLRRLS